MPPDNRPANEDKLIAAIRDIVENAGGSPGPFTRQEIDVLREIIETEKQYPGSLRGIARFHTTMHNLGILGGALQKVVLWFIFGIGVIISLKSGFLAWLAEELGRK